MSNRFLFLEKELSVFDANNTKNKKQSLLSKVKSKYSMQKIAPAVAAAIIGTGWKIIEFLASNSGGERINVQLIKLQGEKFPNDDKKTYDTGVWKTKPFSVKGHYDMPLWPDTLAIIDVRFSYNGHGVADIDMTLEDTEDAPLFTLTVTSKMKPGRNNYRSKIDNKLMSMIELTFSFRFTKAGVDDIFVIKRYELYGDGTVLKK